MYKVIKYNNYRFNFSKDGKHYSLQEEYNNDYCYDGLRIELRCKEDKDFFKAVVEFMDFPQVEMKQGQAYKDIDFSEIFKVIEKYL